MSIFQAILVLIENLPAIIRLLDAMGEQADKEELRKKVASDIKTIEDAFRNKDAEALNKLFRS